MNKINVFLLIGLVASVICNAFLIGFMLNGPKFKGPRPPNPIMLMERAVHKLPGNVRKDVEAIIDAKRLGFKTLMEAGKDDMDVVREHLLSDDLDIETLDIIFQPIADHHKNFSEKLGLMFKEIARAIPDPEQRRMFFENALPRPPPMNGNKVSGKDFKHSGEKMRKMRQQP